MDDSFFGFDTSLPDDDGGGGQIAEPPEEEYDALNDETFGSATNGDWEEVHENLVRLTGDLEGCVDTLDSGKRRNFDGSIPKSKHAVQESLSEKANRNEHFKRSDSNADSDLEFNLATMKLDDVDFNYGDGDNDLLGNGIKLDPNVWSSQPFLKDDRKMNLIMNEMNRMDTKNGMALNTTDFLCQQYPSPYQQHTQSQSQVQQQQAHYQHQLQMHPLGFSRPSESPRPQKICTLEDIERNLIMQQNVTKKQQQSEQKIHCSDGVMKSQHHVENILSNHLQTSTATLQQQQRSHIILDKVHMSQPPYTTKPQQMLPQEQSKQHQQQQQQQQQQAQRPLKSPPGLGNAIHQSPAKPPMQQSMDTLMLHHHSQQQQQQQQQQLFPHPQLHMHGPPNRPPPGMPLFPPGMGPRFPQAGHPQMPPHPLLNQHTLMNNFPPHQPRPLPNSHLPIALNNFAMHPNFNAIRAAAATAGGIHPAVFFAQQQQANRTLGHVPPLPPPSSGPPNPVGLLNNQTVQTNPNGNMFNMRLMQEIQQNHPLLRQGHPSQILHQPPMGVGNNNPQAHAQQRNTPFASHQQKQQNYNVRRDSLVSNANGNLPPEEFDEYANLMSTRDKHWLIGIQLSQLNTDTPYIDDYYYTVYRERKAKQSGSVIHSQAHKDNQLNHPLTQPKGHAQLILVQLGNKNGTRNGQQRERHNSENYHGGNNNNNNVVHDLKLPPYLYSPLKFENSLGKLQYGSVTAPRKIIDAEIMNSDATTVAKGTGATTLSEQKENVLNNQTGSKAALPTDAGGVGQITCTPPSELNAANMQRKSRYILLHIESLYRLILKLDDLNNPIAIATILAKKKKESERIAALEQLEAANKTPEERASDAANNPTLKSKFNYEIETKDALVEKLIAGLQHDKVIAMMNVRKGKVLIKRIMPYIEQSEVRWHVWIGVFNALQNVFKKDRDDADGVLYALYPQFKKQIKFANFETIVKISSAITLNDKRAYGVFCSKFGLSSLVCLILQAEHIYVEMDDATLTHEHRGLWRKFLDQVASSLNRTIQNQTICAAIESDSIQPMMDHFARFKDLKLDSLLALIIEAKQQIY